MKLTFVKWYIKNAVYLDDNLIYYGELYGDANFYNLLIALGYTCGSLGEVPTHDIPSQFKSAGTGHWKPPQKLDILKGQFERWQKEELANKIRAKRDELAQLEKEAGL